MDQPFNFLGNKENFAFLPTPIHKLENLTKKLGGATIYIKRDDMTGLALGGNKTRKLEYLIKDALINNHDTVITIGNPQSNHARQTAAACRLYNLECYLILVGKENERKEGNVLLDVMLGANIVYYDNDEIAYEKIDELMEKLKSSGKNPYFIPGGGSNTTGMCGYINAFKEIQNDELNLGVNFDYIVFASSSLGTQSGLIVGNKLFTGNMNKSKKIYGISVCKHFLSSKCKLSDKERIVDLIKQFETRFNIDLKLTDEDVIYDERFNEAGYAIMSEEDKRALDLFAKCEAIILDPVYSGRAAAGLISLIEKGEIPNDAKVLFIHTGGSPALFSNIYLN